MSKRHIGIATSARADFGLLTPLIEALQNHEDFSLTVYATGMHFSPLHGHTIEEVRALNLGADLIEVPCCAMDDTAQAIGESMAAELSSFAKVFAKSTPDILVVLGDRFDILPVVNAALIFNLPVAHINGGEVTEGAMDDSIRHAITKMSHLHFTANELYSQRVIQLGEESWRVLACGEPGLDGIQDMPRPPRGEFLESLGLASDRPITLLTHHPETLNPDGTAPAIKAILSAADTIDSQIVFTFPNADTGFQPIIDAIKSYCHKRDDCCFHASLGRQRYYALLSYADCMVGNSSSGLIEAPTFALPVVNIGNRQKGRIMAANVIQAVSETTAIATAWRKALSPDFRQSLGGMVNPYGDGRAVERILGVLKSTPLGEKLMVKKFHDILAGAV